MITTSQPLPSLATRVISGGRVDVQNMLNDGTFPLPSRPRFLDESFRLNSLRMADTVDLDFIDNDADGQPEFALETFGFPVDEPVQPVLYSIGTDGSFTNVTYGRDGAPGGVLPAAFDALPNLAGNYNKTAVGNLNADSCPDIVLGHFFEIDPAADPSDSFGVTGAPNILLFQLAEFGRCTGRFRNATDDVVAGARRLPTRNDLTRGVEIFDFDDDGDMDIYFTNAVFPRPGGDLGDQLLVNQLVETGDARFVDRSDRIILPPGPPSGDPHNADTSVCCDVDQDGFIDLVQAVNGDRNRLFMNRVAFGAHFLIDEAARAGFPFGTGFSHDVECRDITGPRGLGPPDGYPEIIFARRDDLRNLYLTNNGDGTFSDSSILLSPPNDTTQEVELCDLDGDGIPEILFGNGDVVSGLARPNRVLRRESTTGRFIDAATFFNLTFFNIPEITEDIECGDLNGDGIADVFVGNTGARNRLYLSQ